MNSSTSLQIPSADSPPGPSRHNQSPSNGAPNAARPVSVSVHPTPVTPQNVNRRQRASHTVVSASSQQQHHQTQNVGSRDENSLYTDVYSHPAAMAYAAAHPRRTIPKFGPYLLLQTLGEGEFGKVKLGLHCQWGEEVAVKLIRRGNVDSTVRMSKVEREIEVLRTLKHPNIVRLYDVIETDKYIGIILEYASGGELFDHILAHRYLRERDAAKLFSQLISGVWYIHQKKIVHRDLKLENLLLDKNRNVIITDFGFANRFEHRADDLMQTSCGSPCYAAPELVISEGLYVGSAVDIWSCGVILYAMLAGYLPFDDDPANPDGDNINLLYKYIVNTPLSFPEYISKEARDILGMMLVPDPTRRASLEEVMSHSWLAAYAVPRDGITAPAGTSVAFGKSVEQLERSAMEQHQQKRLAYQKQMKAAAAAISASPASITSSAVGRSQSHQIDAFTGTAARPGGSGRSRSTQPEYLYDSSIDQSYASSAPAPTPPSASVGQRKMHGSPAALGLDEDDPFAAPGSVINTHKSNLGITATAASDPPSATATNKSSNNKALGVDSTQSPKSGGGHKSGGGGGFRHTIQVEYDDSSPKAGRKSDDREREKRTRERGGSQDHGQTPQSASVTETQVNGTEPRERRTSQGSMKPLPPSPGPITSSGTSSYHSPPASAPPTTLPLKNGSPSPSNTPIAAKYSTQRPAAITPPRVTPTVSINPASPPDTPITFAAPAQGDYRDKDTASRESSVKGHRKGRSSLDKLGFAKIFGSGGSIPNGTNAGAQQLNGRVPSEGGTSGNGSKNGSSVLLSANSDSEKVKDKGKGKEVEKDQGKDTEKDKGRDAEKDKEPKEGKKSRRNTLTVMVEPFSRTIRGRTPKGRMASTPTGTAEPASSVDGRGKGLFKGQPQSAVLPSTNGTGVAERGVKSAVEAAPSYAGATGEMGEGAGGVGMNASTSKARKVMQWFRAKSKVREGVPGADEEEQDQTRSGTPTQAEYRKGNAVSSSTLQLQHFSRSPTAPVQVIVTTPAGSTPTTSRAPGSFPSKSAASGHPHRTASNATDSSFTTSSLVTRFRNSVTVGGGGGSHTTSSSSAKTLPWSSIRIHHGAVDQTTITTKPPPEVIKHVKEVLEGMGVEIQMESEYKYRCVRAKRRKGSMIMGSAGGATTGLGNAGPAPGASSGSTAGLAAITIVGSAASNGVDKRGLPLPSPSAFSGTGGMLRGLLMRRQTSQVSTGGMGSSQPSLTIDDDAPIVVEPTSIHETAYGDPSQDAGDEVRFSVELTRIDRLNDTFSLDIRRLKGNLRSYKFLYDTIRQRADLQR